VAVSLGHLHHEPPLPLPKLDQNHAEGTLHSREYTYTHLANRADRINVSDLQDNLVCAFFLLFVTKNVVLGVALKLLPVYLAILHAKAVWVVV